MNRKIHFRQGDKKILCEVISISTGKKICSLIDSSFAGCDMFVCFDKMRDFRNMIEDFTQNSKEWDAGYNYRLELVNSQL
jgi:hypothetical protein